MSTFGNPTLSQYGSGLYGASPIEVLQIAYYMNLLTSEYQPPNSPKWNAFLYAMLKKWDDVSQCQVLMDQVFDIDNAQGVQLDEIGVIVGVNRQMRSSVMVGSTVYTEFPDYAYRLLLKLFIAMNQWNGTIPGIYQVFNTVLGSFNFGLVVQDNQDMSMFYVFLTPPSDPILLAILSQGYFDLRPAGVTLLGYFTPSIPGAPIFGFDQETSLVQGYDQGCWLVPLP